MKLTEFAPKERKKTVVFCQKLMKYDVSSRLLLIACIIMELLTSNPAYLFSIIFFEQGILCIWKKFYSQILVIHFLLSKITIVDR